jgi:hypothetical protein
MRSVMIVFSMVAVAGCASNTASFRPTTAAATTRTGDPAAAYEIRENGGNRAAQVIVWSDGAYQTKDGHMILQVAAEVQNVGNAPVSLDPASIELQAFDANGAQLPAPPLSTIQPPGAETQPVAPGTSQDFELIFTAQGQVGPEHLGSLHLRWAVTQPDGRRYVQFTDFTRDVERAYGAAYAYVPVYGVYDPFWIGPAPVFVHHYNVPVRRMASPGHRYWRRYR